MTPLGKGGQVPSCPLQHFLLISDFQEEIPVSNTLANITISHIHPWRNKIDQMDVLPLPSLPSDVPWAHLGTLSVPRSSCSALPLPPHWTTVSKPNGRDGKSGTSQVGSNSSWNQEPKSTSSGLSGDRKSPSFQSQSCWSLPGSTNRPLHTAMGK